MTVILLSLLNAKRAIRLFAGVAAAAAVCAAVFGALGALDELYRQLWVENYLGDKYVQNQPRQFC